MFFILVIKIETIVVHQHFQRRLMQKIPKTFYPLNVVHCAGTGLKWSIEEYMFYNSVIIAYTSHTPFKRHIIISKI